MDVYKTPGAFSWSELTTTDPAAAATCHSQLFGWSIKEMDVPTVGRIAVLQDPQGAVLSVIAYSAA